MFNTINYIIFTMLITNIYCICLNICKYSFIRFYKFLTSCSFNTTSYVLVCIIIKTIYIIRYIFIITIYNFRKLSNHCTDTYICELNSHLYKLDFHLLIYYTKHLQKNPALARKTQKQGGAAFSAAPPCLRNGFISAAPIPARRSFA